MKPISIPAEAAFWTKAQSLVLFSVAGFSFTQTLKETHNTSLNKTKDWALVQNAAMVINIEVMELGLGLVT